MAEISIVIVSYNTRDYLRQCLDSLYETGSESDFEVIVVDNGSTDGSCEMIESSFPEVRVVRTGENAGFSKAVNRGVREACGKHILFLNSDTKVLPNALKAMADFLDSRPDAAVVSAHVVYPDFTDQGVARRFPTPLCGIFGRRSLITRLWPNHTYARSYILSSDRMGPAPLEVDWVSGACLMVRADVLRDVGLLDEKFWMYWEDADLCYRIKQRGWKVFCIPSVLVIHFEGRSVTRRASSRSIIEFHKSACWYFQKRRAGYGMDLACFTAVLCISLRMLLKLMSNEILGIIGETGIPKNEGSANHADAATKTRGAQMSDR